MTRRIDATHGAWALLAVILLGVILFGAVGDLPLFLQEPAGDLPGFSKLAPPRFDLRLNIRHAFVGLCMALAAISIFCARKDERPGRGWTIAVALFPLWIAFQLIPLPVEMVETLSPRGAEMAHTFHPGPIHDCEGEVLVAAEPPPSHPLTLDKVATLEELFVVLAAGLVFFAARTGFRAGSSTRRRVLTTVAVFGVAEALYGLAVWAGGGGIVLWVPKISHFDVATGTLMNRNHFAALLYLALACTLTLLVTRTSEKRANHDRERETAIRTTLMLFVGVLLVGLMASRSRAGIGIGILTFLSATPWLLRGRGAVRAVAVGMLFLVAVPAALMLTPAIYERMAVVDEEWSNASGRGAVFQIGRQMAGDFALTGTGAGTFAPVFAIYRDEAFRVRYNYAHNDYLQTVIETGIVGLCLAIIPIALWAAGWIGRLRRHRQTRDHPWPWPLIVALLGLLGHEFVDFSLKIPAILMLAALLAGIASPPLARRGSRLSLLLAGVGLVLAPLAVAHSLGRWPALVDTFARLELPEGLRHQAELSFDRWSDAVDDSEIEADPADFCRAMDLQAAFQRRRPINSWGPLTYASRGVRGLARPEESGFSGEEHTAEVRAAADRARRLDPLHAQNRRRLMNISFAMLDPIQGLEDATVAVQQRTSLARRLVTELVDRAGVPPRVIARIMGDHPMALRTLLIAVLEMDQIELAGELVPKDLRANLAFCYAGPWVKKIFDKAHQEPILPFYEQCLQNAEVAADERLVKRLHIWTAREHLHQGEVDQAYALLAQLPDDADRWWLAIDLEEARSNWDEVLTNGWKLQERWAVKKASVWQRARLQIAMGTAYACRGEINKAVTRFRNAAGIQPSRQTEQRLSQLLEGKIPFACESRTPGG